uniref:Uncharacterized protein n=1 Tax=Oryza barthii TaxID=65489 RepID=A0A0D3HX30_9ORYZ
MGRSSACCDKAAVKPKRGAWTAEDDERLRSYIQQHGTGGNWMALPRKVGLRRCGKSCRLRWLNYLRPGIRHGAFSDPDDRLILALHAAVGTRWSLIAAHLPGRTDNHLNNYWNNKKKKTPPLLLAAHQLHVASTSSGGMHVGVGEGHGYDDVFAAAHSLSSTAATSFSSGGATELDEIFRSTGTSGGDCSSSAQTRSTDDALMMMMMMMMNWHNHQNQLQLQGELQGVQQQQQQFGFGMPYW